MPTPFQHSAAHNTESARPALTLQALRYRRIEPVRGHEVKRLEQEARALGMLVAEEREHICGHDRAADYVISSTILSMLLMNGSPQHHAFIEGVAGQNDYPPEWMTCSYECAGWGYVFRRAFAKAASSNSHVLLLQIVDVDVHGFTYWHGNPAWGNSGFGVCTMLVDVADSVAAPLRNMSAPPQVAVVQMGRELRGFYSQRPGVSVALPFFPPTSRRAMLAAIGKTPLCPDGHARFGHSFGSDPWIALLLAQAEARDADIRQNVIVSSLALNGYYSIAEVGFAPGAQLSLEL
ncbi:hypothetical protein WM40_03115 [Robbsia andropogonis]|uniref:Uncharacterized protein n=1 Tax=Robbsia andropogonis TaxID=28092 RepID=A0A0F5K4B2_9BURK|nr:hypothetical protein [Robbsia andropogonis]KKB64971.1 hypothetical protein WM40_03115 [Robbsia andropogonis]